MNKILGIVLVLFFFSCKDNKEDSPLDENILCRNISQKIIPKILEFNQVKFAPPQGSLEGLLEWQQEIQYIVKQFPDLRALVSKIVITEDFDFIYIEKDNLNAFKEAIMYKKNHPTFANEKIGYFKADNRFNIEPLNLNFNEGDFWIGILDSQNPGIKGDNVSNAKVQSNERINTDYVISLEFDNKASTEWESYTGSNIGKQVAITLDNEVLTYPTIQSRISGASQITGFDSYEKAQKVIDSIITRKCLDKDLESE